MGGTLLQAIREGDGGAVAALLAEDPALASARSDEGISAVLLALYHGHPDIAEALAAARSELDVFEAAALGRSLALAALLEADATLANAVAVDGFSPMGLAAFFGQTTAMEVLFDRGADPDTPSANPMRVRPLHSACAQRDPDKALAAATLLLERGADANVAQHGGWTPLQQAAKTGNVALVEVLLAHGADRAATSDDGHTAAGLAEEAGHGRVAHILSAARS